MGRPRDEDPNPAFHEPLPSWASPIPGALWLRTWRLGEWLDGPLSPLFQTFLVPLLVAARERGGSGCLGKRLPKMWRVRAPAYCVIHGYLFSRAEPIRSSVTMLPLRFLGSELFGDWIKGWETECLPLFSQRIAEHDSVDVETASHSTLLRRLEALALDI